MTSQALATHRDRHLFVANTLTKKRDQLAALLPSSMGLTPERATRVALDALIRNPALLNCEPRSIIQAVFHAAEVGLPLGSPLGEAYLIPYKQKATMMIGYRGFGELIRRSPRVRSINGILVREGDEFDVDEAKRKIHHRWGSGGEKARGQITYVYSLVTYEPGPHDAEPPVDFDVMSRDEVLKIKNDVIKRSHGRDTPWNGPFEDAMWKKCPIRRHAKLLELHPVARRGLERDDLESMKRGEMGSLVQRDGTFDTGRAQELKDMLGADAKRDEEIVVDAEIEEGGGA